MVCFVDPTSGGTTASIASLSDIAISEPGATIAFSGRRVIEGILKGSETLPPNFQTAEWVKEKSGQEHRLQAFYKKAKKGKLDNEGNPLKHDIDAFFALINKEDFVIIQHYIFDKILVSKDNFLAHN